MFALLGELKLWSLNEDICIKDTDFGAFRYYDKRIDNLYDEGKRSYCQKRGMIYTPQNKKGVKLKDSLKYLEEQLKDHSTIYCQWNDHCTVSLMLGSGLLIYIQISPRSGDIEKIVFDKYLVGKVSDHISDMVITKSHLFCTYIDSQVTLVHFTKSKRHVFDKISRLEPKITTFELFGPSGRRLDKKIQLNRSGDLILIWWKSTMNEVYPWSPTIKEQDRANVQLYRLTGTKMDSICYLRTEFDPLCITFDTRHENVIHSIEQKVSRKGEVTIEWRTYEVSQQDKLQRIAVVSVPLPTHTSCVKFSPNQEMLLLCCIDGSMTLHDQSKGTSNTVKAAFIPTLASWHGDGAIFAVGNERGQFQHFDISLSCIKNQMLSEEATPANILDLSTYFRNQPALFRMEWSKTPDPEFSMQYYKTGDALFLLLFERGPLGVLKIIEGSNFPGDALVEKYLGLGQVERATSLLLSMNWDLTPQICMHSLNQILNYLFKLPLTSEREYLIQNALGSFHVPTRPISQIVEDEYGDEVRDLTRRFFHHLLRFRLFEKAFRLAIDLNDHDLFMDIHFYAVAMKDSELAKAAREKAEEILSRSNSCNSSHSTCSRPSCSLCSDSVSEKEDESYTEESESEDATKKEKTNFNLPKNRPKTSNTQAPPLPVLHSSLYNSSNFVSTSFKDPTFEKSDENLMSTAFNLPTYSPGSFNNLVHLSPNIPQIPSLSKTPLSSSSKQINSNFSQSLSSIEGLIPGFGSLNLHSKSFNPIETSFGKSPFEEGAFGKTAFSEEAFGQTNFSEEAFGQTTFSEEAFGKTTFSEEAFGKTSFVEETFEPLGKPFSKEKAQDSISTSFSDKSFISTRFIEPSYESVSGSSSLLETPENLSGNLPFNGKPIGLFANPGNSLFYNSGSNLMSTSFNDPEEEEGPVSNPVHNQKLNPSLNIPKLNQGLNPKVNPSPNPGFSSQVSQTIEQKKSQRISPFDIPPPPSMSTSLANYIQNLPKKNFPLSRSTPGLTEMEESILRIQNSMSFGKPTQIVHQQSSVSNILQNQQRSNKFLSTRNYRLNYDLNYVPFTGSCDNLTSSRNVYQGKSYSGSKEPRQFRFGQGPENKDGKKFSNIPPLPVINPTYKNSSTEVPNTSNEKPKVKFSDTVTHILVPGSGQVYRPIQKRSTLQLHPMDPKRELAESLPLCLGNDDYLKDFQPLSKDKSEKVKEPPKTEETAKIKVVHFGLL